MEFKAFLERRECPSREWCGGGYVFASLAVVVMTTSLKKLPPQISLFVCFMVQDAHRLSLAYRVCEPQSLLGLLSFKFEESICLQTPMVVRDFPKNTRKKTK